MISMMKKARRARTLFAWAAAAVIFLTVFWGVLAFAPKTGGAAGAESVFAGGAGTAESPYIVTRAEELFALRGFCGAGTRAHFLLATDIDLAPALAEGGALFGDGRGWLPIGTYDAPFGGVFEGGGHTVANLWANRADAESLGLFGVLRNADISGLNITVSPLALTGGAYAGGLAGVAASDTRSSQIAGCSVSGTVSIVDGELADGPFAAQARGALGGLVGISDGISVAESYFWGTLKNTSPYATGGLIGFAAHTYIDNCYARAELDVMPASAAGGIFGQNRSTVRDFPPNIISRSFSEITSHIPADAFVGQQLGKPCEVNSSYGIGTAYISDDLTKYLAGTARLLGRADSRTRSAYAQFDFDSTWGLYDGISTPYLARFQNVVIIRPFGKTYDGTPKLNRSYEILGNTVENKPITAEITATDGEFVNAGLYDARVRYQTDFAYQVFVMPYEIKRAVLTVRAPSKTLAYGKRLAPLAFEDCTVTGFQAYDDIRLVSGQSTVTVFANAARPKRGANHIAVSGDLKADNYEVFYAPGTLTVTGLYPYETALIALSGTVVAALGAYIVYLVVAKKKRPADLLRLLKKLFVRERTVTVEVVRPAKASLPTDLFTPKEQQVAELLILGKSRREIAEALFVSENTAKTHTQNIFSKCEVTSQKAFIGKYLLGSEQEVGKE